MVGTKHGVALSGGGLQEKWSEAQDLAKTNHKAGKTSLNLLTTAFMSKDRDHLPSRIQFMEMKISAIF
jgi:hypothetical protein